MILTRWPDRTLHFPLPMARAAYSLNTETKRFVSPSQSSMLCITLIAIACRFIPIVFLAMVFNLSNAVGFTYAYVTRFTAIGSVPQLTSIAVIVTPSKNGQTSSVPGGVLEASVAKSWPVWSRTVLEGCSDERIALPALIVSLCRAQKDC